MKLKLYAHLAILFQISAFIFLFCYILLSHALTFPIILLLSFSVSEIILCLFLEIQVVPFE